MNTVTWDLLVNNVESVTQNEFTACVEFLHGYSNCLSEVFYNKIISRLPNIIKYLSHPVITDAFLKYEATNDDKIEILKNKEARIDFCGSSEFFKSLPYETIKYFVFGEYAAHKASVYFIDLIIQNKDNDSALSILENSPTQYSLYSILTYNEKIMSVKSNKHLIEINNIFNEEEKSKFINVALLDKNLSKYIQACPLDNINECITIADVTARMTNDAWYLHITDTVLSSLSKESIKRLITRGKYTIDSCSRDLLPELYSKLNRDELIDCVGDITNSDDVTILSARAIHMTETELVNTAQRHSNFLRYNVNKLPSSFLSIYKDKVKFKELVGDRRNGSNNSFACELESILAKI